MVKGLENQLEGIVQLGDLLYLEAENGDKVVGFVRYIDQTKVKLLPEPIGNKYPRVLWSQFSMVVGEDEYLLNQFSEYKVIDLDELKKLAK